MTILGMHDFAWVFQMQKHNRVFQAKIAFEREIKIDLKRLK